MTTLFWLGFACGAVLGGSAVALVMACLMLKLLGRREAARPARPRPVDWVFRDYPLPGGRTFRAMNPEVMRRALKAAEAKFDEIARKGAPGRP